MNLTPKQLLLYNQLKTNEGYREKLYTDSVGKVSIGIGRNLTDVGLRPDEILYLWHNDVLEVEKALDARLPWWRSLDDVRQRVVIDLCFNMGIVTLMTFKSTLAAIQKGDWSAASKGMLSSKWAKQVHDRATKLATMMETGKDVY